MTRSYFITGTDTGVGKTVVTSSIARGLRLRGLDVGVMKPVESGCVDKDGSPVPADALALKEASGATDAIEEICPYRLSLPLSPHLAARMAGAEVDFGVILSVYGKLSARHGIMLVEGAGGLLTPLTDELTVADLAVKLGLPVIIVADSRLGVINHALLTIEAVQRRGLEVGAVILNRASGAADLSVEHNSAEIKRKTGLPVYDFPHVKNKAPGQVAGGLIECLFG